MSNFRPGAELGVFLSFLVANYQRPVGICKAATKRKTDSSMLENSRKPTYFDKYGK